MIGSGCGVVILYVAVDTGHTKWFEAKHGCRFVTTSAIGGIMWPNQWKTAALVHLRSVFHDPRLGCMASLTVWPHGLRMHIGVTVNTIGTCIFKN